MVGGDCPLLREILGQIDPPPSKTDFPSIFARSTSAVALALSESAYNFYSAAWNADAV